MAKKIKPGAPGVPAPAGLGAGGFSLDGGAPLSLGGAAFTLDAVPASAAGPITAPLPDPSRRPGGPGLPIEQEEREELAQLGEQFTHPKLTAAEYYEKKAKEQARRQRAQEYTYWVGLVFATTDDLEAFLQRVEQLAPGIEVFGQWLDGYDFAERVGLRVPRTHLTDPSGNVLEQWVELALEVPPPPEPTVPDGFDANFE